MTTDNLPPLPEWVFRDDLGGLVPSEVRTSMREYGELCRQHALQGVKVSIPTATMEQAFARHYDRGYKAGRQQALEEAATLFDGPVWGYDYRQIAERIRSLK